MILGCIPSPHIHTLKIFFLFTQTSWHFFPLISRGQDTNESTALQDPNGRRAPTDLIQAVVMSTPGTCRNVL